MNIVQFSIIICGFQMCAILAHRTDTWPPYSAIYKHYDVNGINKVCRERSGVDTKEVIEFENTEDFDNLPNSHALKVLLRCIAELTERVETDSNKLILSKAIDFLNDITEEEKLIYLNMGRGCMKRLKSIKDPLEFTYELNVCMKQNDNEHYYIIVDPTTGPV